MYKEAIIYLTTLAALGCAVQEPKPQTLNKAMQMVAADNYQKFLLPGTWTIDMDTLRLPFDKIRLTSSMESLGCALTYDPNSIHFGGNLDDVDLFLNQINHEKRILMTRNGAQIAPLGIVDFESVTLDDITNAPFDTKGIPDSQDQPNLTPGQVFALKTNDGKYLKFRIDRNLPLIYPDHPEESIQNYSMQCSVVYF